MSEWFYTSNGQSNGPVSFETLKNLAASGHFTNSENLVWTKGMDEWSRADQIPGLQPSSTPPPLPDGTGSTPSNPYAAPSTVGYYAPVGPAPDRADITPGSSPIEPTMALAAGWRALRNNAGPVTLFWIAFVAASMAINLICNSIFPPVYVDVSGFDLPSEFSQALATQPQAHPVTQVISFVANGILMLFFCRFMLNVVTRQDLSAGSILAEKSKAWKNIAGGILLYVILIASAVPGGALAFAGFTLAMQDSPLGVPLILAGSLLAVCLYMYFFARLLFYTYSIVDRNCGPVAALKDSWNITRNNFWRLALIGLIYFGLFCASGLTLFIGLIIVIPLMSLVAAVAYRWLRVGAHAATDVL
ncbi:GYF domain-containing protein [Sulfuriroseicoccus oceanibius]|uniref:DUF4339 domain-containing protein n=1 Tax=Sulfuriroseicoccus oceanibius TaxID=2707525 RepID=A0A6B3L5I8_9BACT|nr:GYF domain-containing protein [Sulfuriroseicoccus oceanibius]QQL45324.1 DUF4339 domain-containing protein [Sulfuriroseicoccus oceanibius]